MEEEDAAAATSNESEELVGPNEVVARASDGTNFYLYTHQAGGHTPFLRSSRGSVCKPVVALELQFYEALGPKFPQLRPFVPQFLGKISVDLNVTPQQSSPSPSASPAEPLTMPKKMPRRSFGKKRRLNKSAAPKSGPLFMLEGGYSAKLWNEERAKTGKKPLKCPTLTRCENSNTKDYMVLGDLTRNFRRPCVLDIKLGTRQHGEDATPAKIYDERDGTYTIWDKSWGRQLKASGIEPALETYLTSGTTVRWDALDKLLIKIRQFKDVVATTTGLRCWGSSLLLIYEGDQRYGRSCSDVRLIDFAHCQMSPSLGTPDKGMLLGLTNIERYLNNIAARAPLSRLQLIS
ncbi:inositol hexakisphosphate kinase 3 [Phytophthora boehmeriae]|uniref:Kinase n=1 Tax=Phytophthora boehmeriae TaxID=109152 RepID=A0A8T1WZF3_9STRA|nr:inositol hexakisphosphate kinase 3 [Phytophthora boehmeriae]